LGQPDGSACLPTCQTPSTSAAQGTDPRRPLPVAGHMLAGYEGSVALWLEAGQDSLGNSHHPPRGLNRSPSLCPSHRIRFVLGPALQREQPP
jgi:hypothetical protein